MSSPCWSLPHLFSSSPPQHATLPGQRDFLQEDTVHPEPLPQESSPKTSANAIRSESNAKESLSHLNYESAGNLRPNTPTGYEPNERLLQFRQFLEVLLKILINCTMHRENLENKINKLQILKKSRNSDKARHKAYSITRWQKCHLLRICPDVLPPVQDVL